MPAASLLALLDDIAGVLDDVAALTKVASKQTAGVLGDDLALNAEQVAGVRAERELPVVWAVAKGSLVNKAILVPVALALSAFAPFLVTPLLVLGGSYLAYEGAEKVLHGLARRSHDANSGPTSAPPSSRAATTGIDPAALERTKIRGAIRTDFILSAEIVIIALGTVATETLLLRSLVLVALSVAMTVFVYGLVAVLVKADDVAVHLVARGNPILRTVGRAVLVAAPRFMRLLAAVGTLAMFLVGGGIVVHAFHALADRVAAWERAAASGTFLLRLVSGLVPALANATVGAVLGVVLVGVVTGIKRVVIRQPV
ncbi:MAG: DUF808 domain-containing protein [Polyangiaceae bacterium]